MTESVAPRVEPDRKKAVCSRCAGVRNCSIRCRFEERGGDENYQYITEWNILQCLGCDYVFCQTVSSNSEEYEHYYEDDGSMETRHTENIDYWPALSKRDKPVWFDYFNSDLDKDGQLYSSLAELYGALDGGLFILAGIGIRTSFDVASGLLGVEDRKTFGEKLDALVDGQHIGKVDRDRLETLVAAGSASAHRGWRPNLGDIDGMMAILEHFLHAAFVAPEQKRKLDEQAIALRAKVPVRVRASKITLLSSTEAPPSPASSPCP